VKNLILIIFMVCFMTISIYGEGPATVNLGTAGNFVILACTGVSTTGTTSIIGDIGVSPVAATYMTGFGLIMDASGTFSTSSLVTGNIYAADYTEPTPTNLTAAVGDMGIAYTDAAGRLNPDYTELYAGDLTGQTLIPGLYKWSSGILVSAGGLTIAGGPNDVWIFQIAQNVTIADGAIITLSGGAQPQNIFWQIAGQLTLGTTAQFKGIILCQTLVSMNTGASVNGRLLAQTAVTSDQNSVVQPTSSTEIHEDEIPSATLKSSLEANYPNPFTPYTSIKFNIGKDEQGVLIIYNVKGQLIFQKRFASGKHNFEWTTKGLSSGIYLYRLKTNTIDITKKMNLIK
jgi:hypothetical protein